MNEWRTVKLGDCCTKLGSGATPKGGASVYIDKGTSLIRSQNVYNLHFDYEGLAHINDDAAKKLSGVTVFENDVLINITGDSVARTCIVPNDVLPARVNQHVLIIRPDAKVLNPRYLNYYLASEHMQAIMLGLAVGKGASRNAMTKDMIASFEIPCPSIERQNSIVDVLSAYDDLIENNQKQIKLLEEAAQRLYKEWFVDLRFPGHENVKIVDGVPEGWSIKRLDQISELKAGGDRPKVFSKEKNDSCYIPIYSNGTVDEGLYGYTNCAAIKEKSVTISARGSVGYTCIRLHPFVPIVRLITIIPRYIDVFYLYYYLKNLHYDSNGAAQQQITVPMIKDKEIMIPDESTLKCFVEKSSKIIERIDILKQANERLSESRDRLLPKLMNGEIEV